MNGQTRTCEALPRFGHPCGQRVGIRALVGADGELHAFCPIRGHRANVVRRFGEATEAELDGRHEAFVLEMAELAEAELAADGLPDVPLADHRLYAWAEEHAVGAYR